MPGVQGKRESSNKNGDDEENYDCAPAAADATIVAASAANDEGCTRCPQWNTRRAVNHGLDIIAHDPQARVPAIREVVQCERVTELNNNIKKMCRALTVSARDMNNINKIPKVLNFS